jgi:hypothetical protein
MSANDLSKAMKENILNGNYPNIHAVLISKGPDLVYEGYFPETDRQAVIEIGQVQCLTDYLHSV